MITAVTYYTPRGYKGQNVLTWACHWGKDGAVFRGRSVQETVQGADETHGAQVSRQELLQTQL